MDALSRLAEEATALARQAAQEREAHMAEMSALKAENGALRSEIARMRIEQAEAVQAAVTRIGRNPDTSRAMEEAFQEGRRAGLTEAAVMAETYVFHGRTGEPIRLGIDPDYVPALQVWLAEHIRARAEGHEEPERVMFDPRGEAA